MTNTGTVAHPQDVPDPGSDLGRDPDRINRSRTQAECIAGWRDSWRALKTHTMGGSVSSRLTLAYGIWGLLQWPILMRLYQMMDLWEIYVVCLAAPLVSWHGSLQYYGKELLKTKTVNIKGLLLAVALMVCALLATRSIAASSILSAAGLLVFREVLTGESLGTLMIAGGISLLFMVPLPLGLLEYTAGGLSQLHAWLIPFSFEPLTGISTANSGHTLSMSTGHHALVARECSGIRSLIALSMFGAYYANGQRHGWGGILLTCLGAAFIAVFLNQVRAVFSCVLVAAENEFWTSDVGHNLLGLIIATLGMMLVQALARDLFIDEDLKTAGCGSRRQDR